MWCVVVGFNPTLVRLRRAQDPTGAGGVGVFQSHAGSIEAGAHQAADGQPGGRFNPTLVRLRPGKTTLLNALLLGFNPTLVRLRRPEAGGPSRPRRCVSIPRWFD